MPSYIPPFTPKNGVRKRDQVTYLLSETEETKQRTSPKQNDNQTDVRCLISYPFSCPLSLDWVNGLVKNPDPDLTCDETSEKYVRGGNI